MAQAARKSQSNVWAVSGVCRQKTGGRPSILGAVVRCACSKAGHDERGGADAAAALTAHAEATATPDSYWVAEDGSGVTIANFCSDGIGYVMDKTPDAAEPSFYFMILR